MKIYDYEDLNKKRPWDYEGDTSPEDDGITPLVITDKKIELMDVLIINGIAYTLCTARGRGGTYLWGLVDKTANQNVFVLNEKPEDMDYKDDLTCPYCGHEEGDSWELSNEEDDHECGSCGSIFSYQRNVTVEYSSQPVKKVNAIVLK